MNFIYFLTLVNVIIAKSDQDKPTTCTSRTCGGRGECRIDNMGKVKCDCYQQYYKGTYCDKPSDPCNDFSIAINPYVRSCVPTTIFGCTRGYGINLCECKKFAHGRYCELEGKGAKNQEKGPVVLMNLEPESGSDTLIAIGSRYYSNYKSFTEWDPILYAPRIIKFHVVIDGAIYDYASEDLVKESSSKYIGALRHILKEERSRTYSTCTFSVKIYEE